MEFSPVLKPDEELLALRASIKFVDMPSQFPIESHPMSIGASACVSAIVSARPTWTNENLYRMLKTATAQNVKSRMNKLSFEPKRIFVQEGAVV